MTPVSPIFVNIVPPWIAKRPTAQPQVVQPQAPQQMQPVMSYPQPVFYTDPVEQRRAMGIDFSKEMPWLTDKAIQTALSELRSLTFSPDDLRYLQSMGVETPFKSGKECVDFIEKENIRILFDKPAQNDVHAQYEFLKNTVTINDRYKGTTDFAIMLAIAEAILHEAGHAKDKDSDSSIQEELNFLGMNAVAHRAFIKKYGDIFSDTKEPIVNDGVSLYAKLFFEPDPYKRNLVNRIKEKYGDLPAGDRLHPPGKIARAAKSA